VHIVPVIYKQNIDLKYTKTFQFWDLIYNKSVKVLSNQMKSNKSLPSVATILRVTLISGFRRDVDKICGLLGNYTASCGNYLPTFRYNVSVPSSQVKIPSRKGILTRKDGTDMLSRNVGK
jgi:hypothetical protein